MSDMSQTREVLMRVFEERVRQQARYGDVNVHTESGTGPGTRWLLPYTFDDAQQIQQQLRYDYEDFEGEGNPVTWVHLVREELAEAFELEPDDPNLPVELIQVAALCVSWVERLTARSADTLVVRSERLTNEEALR